MMHVPGPYSRSDELRELYRYNRWANARVLDAAAALSAEQFTRDLGSSFPSVRDTLVHILAGEWVWLSRWQGVSPRRLPEEWASSTFEELRTRWSEVEAEQAAFVSALEDARLEEPISYFTTGGRPFTSPLRQLLRHVVNHSTYHRGQVTTLLRQLGAEGCSTDLILCHRSAEVEAR